MFAPRYVAFAEVLVGAGLTFAPLKRVAKLGSVDIYDLARVSQYNGHSNNSVTESVYARFAPDHLSDAASASNFGFAPTSAD